MKITKEQLLSIFCGLLAITTSVMCILNIRLGVYISMGLESLIIIGLLINFVTNYKLDAFGIILLILGVYILVSETIFLFAFNNFLWADKVLVVMFNALLIILELISSILISADGNLTINTLDHITQTVCIVTFVILFLILLNINLKKYTSKAPKCAQ